MQKLMFTITAILLLSASSVLAQGSIFGSVVNSDESSPSPGRLSFFGYLNASDEEIRIVTSDGAGYDGGFWFDDFQNYQTESPGIPYDFHFCDVASGQVFHLNGLVPDNSFQQEDIQLASGTYPTAPNNITVQNLDPTSVRIDWRGSIGSTYHVYRRQASSNGSYFRIDNPSGDLADHGVSDTFFVDSSVEAGVEYVYLVIAEDASGNYSPVIAPAECGDLDHSGNVDIDDVIFAVNYIFLGGPAPNPLAIGNADCLGDVDIDDVIFMVNYIFLGGNSPCDPDGDSIPDC
jgi:hypothetical protein